ncbi:hypothetical protein [Rhodanobacter hydrolyticus]|uniref:DoxX family protein n=1 Tax=Rhodanobacter hydrolyticus TaxID=2250595 RepID=A0ABW8JAF6_9GAMM
MNTTLQHSRLLFAAAMIALGVTGLVNGDFALAWQQVPIHHPPTRTAVAYACAFVELALGIGLLLKRTLPPTCRALFPYMMLWLALLEIPGVVQAPQEVGNWGSFGEIAIITAGAWCLFVEQAGVGNARRLGFAVGPRGLRAARWLLVVALPMIGVEVIVDAVKFGDHVMQPWLQWLPWPMAWACLTGVGSIATCLALLFGVWPRLAATAEAAMLGIITVTYWGPDLYTGRTATTALIISFLITAGVWLVADTYRSIPWLANGRAIWNN